MRVVLQHHTSYGPVLTMGSCLVVALTTRVSHFDWQAHELWSTRVNTAVGRVMERGSDVYMVAGGRGGGSGAWRTDGLALLHRDGSWAMLHPSIYVIEMLQRPDRDSARVEPRAQFLGPKTAAA